MPLGDLIQAIVDNYVPEADASIVCSSVEPSPRICGSWVEVLPDLLGNDTNSVLAPGIRAFALTILSRGPKHRVSIASGLEAYQQALIKVNHALEAPYNAFPVELGAGVMCLLLAELHHLTTLCSWTAHLQGLAGLMQLSPPEFFVSGIPHRLFVGARPALVVLAFLSRKPSFLAKEEWKTVPFLETSPSPVQALMSEAAAIPEILEKLDSNGADAVACEALADFETILSRLYAWEDASRPSSLTTPPLFWLQPSSEAQRPHIWFQNITTANALTHLWAFEAICLQKIAHLRAARPQQSSEHAAAGVKSDEAKRLSVMICQSIEYLMQEEMKLFGPTSVILPLRTAYETFKASGVQAIEELAWCKRIVGDIRNRGYGFMMLLLGVDGPPS